MTSGPLCALPELMSGPLRHPIHMSLCVPGSVKRSPHVGWAASFPGTNVLLSPPVTALPVCFSPGDRLARLRQPKEAKTPTGPLSPVCEPVGSGYRAQLDTGAAGRP